MDLSSDIQASTEEGLTQLLSIDQDISQKIQEISQYTLFLDQMSKSIEEAIIHNKKIYIYGCGATGRLAKQIEIDFWKKFWCKIKSNNVIWTKLEHHFNHIDIENAVIGEITGADRALVSSLEGFEDLQLIGKLQLEDHNVKEGDIILAVTEGGETSSVIGTILAGCEQYGTMTPTIISQALQHLYFIYNNPDKLLMPFDRSRTVLTNEAITKISLVTGPQAIAGSTRMQATTISTFVIGIILENVLDNILKTYLSPQERAELGFSKDMNIKERLLSFLPVQQSVYKIKNSISELTDLESATYMNGKFSTYFAKEALVTVFIDSTERSPTFNLNPLDTVKEKKRKSLVQVWTEAENLEEAWFKLLDRKFQGLNNNIYEKAFSQIR